MPAVVSWMVGAANTGSRGQGLLGSGSGRLLMTAVIDVSVTRKLELDDSEALEMITRESIGRRLSCIPK